MIIPILSIGIASYNRRMLYPVGQHIDLRKNKNQPVKEARDWSSIPGTYVDLWKLRRQRFAEKFSVMQITNNMLAMI